MKVKVTEQVVREIEVDLPIFRRQDVGDYDRESVVHTLVCPDERGHVVDVSLHLRDDSVEIEIEGGAFDSRHSEAYQLGTGEYAGSRATFEAALKRAEEMLARVRRLLG